MERLAPSNMVTAGRKTPDTRSKTDLGPIRIMGLRESEVSHGTNASHI